MRKLTAETHPNIFKAFIEIDYDNGMVNRLEPERTWYYIPRRFQAIVPTIERVISTLTAEQLETFCTGEEAEMKALITTPDLQVAHDFLNAYFEGFPQGAEHRAAAGKEEQNDGE